MFVKGRPPHEKLERRLEEGTGARGDTWCATLPCGQLQCAANLTKLCPEPVRRG